MNPCSLGHVHDGLARIPFADRGRVTLGASAVKPRKRDPKRAKAKRVCRLNLEWIERTRELPVSSKALKEKPALRSSTAERPVKICISTFERKLRIPSSTDEPTGPVNASTAGAGF